MERDRPNKYVQEHNKGNTLRGQLDQERRDDDAPPPERRRVTPRVLYRRNK